jgi:2-polyprenyl-6-hydroxyphenyl methylase/3-demethylubiquinone-9 3-methyltransferase
MVVQLDRIYEAYFGGMGEDFGIKVRERVHWIVANAKGKKIIDVGCSQGIISILLGREGKQVLGIDLFQESIDFAKSKLALEPEHVKKMVHFECANILTLDFGKERFDTVILGEVLEHLADSKEMLKKITSLLSDDGQVILTVPFGINDYPDHKKTYYLYNLLEEIEPFLSVEEVVFFGKWLGLKAVDKKENEIKYFNLELARKLEDEFYKLERSLLTENKRLQGENYRYKNKLAELEKKLEERANETQAYLKQLGSALEREQNILDCELRDSLKKEKQDIFNAIAENIKVVQTMLENTIKGKNEEYDTQKKYLLELITVKEQNIMQNLVEYKGKLEQSEKRINELSIQTQKYFDRIYETDKLLLEAEEKIVVMQKEHIKEYLEQEKKISQLKTEIEKLKGDAAVLKSDYEQGLTHRNNELTNLKREYDEYREKMNQIVQDNDQQLAIYSSKARELQTKVDELSNALAEVSIKLSRKELFLSCMEKEINDITGLIKSQIKQTSSKLVKANKEKIKAFKMFRIAKAEYIRKLKEKESRVRHLSNKVENQRREFFKQLKCLEEKLLLKEEEHKQLEVQLKQKDDTYTLEIEVLNKQINELKQENQISLHEKEKALAEAHWQIAQLSEQLEKTVLTAEELIKANNELHRQLDEQCVQEYRQITDLTYEKQKYHHELTKALVEKEALVKEYEKKVSEAHNDIKKLSHNLAIAINRCEEILKQNQELGTAIEAREHQCNSLRRELFELQGKHEYLLKRYAALSNSKLGRLTLFKWRYAKKIKAYFFQT